MAALVVQELAADQELGAVLEPAPAVAAPVLGPAQVPGLAQDLDLELVQASAP
jgi:hypothetical protein